MENPAGESVDGPLRLDFDRRVKLEFHGSRITSDAGLLAYRELDDALGLSAMAGNVLADARPGRNGRHALVGLLRQSVFGRLAGYEDVNDAERLRHDPAMRWIVGGKAAQGSAASPSQMGRFETKWLAASNNLSALADLSGQWIDGVHGRRPPRGIVLDMDSSVSPNPNLKALFASNDNMAMGAIEALKSAKMLDKVMVVGFDGNPEAAEAILKGEMAISVAQRPSNMGAVGVESLQKLINGETLPPVVDTGAEIVSKDNAENYK